MFVSHNLQAISNLCNKAIWLEKGVVMQVGPAIEVVNAYLASVKPPEISEHYEVVEEAPGNEAIRLKSAHVQPQNFPDNNFITVRTPVEMNFEFWCFLEDCNLNVNVILSTKSGDCVFNLGTHNIEAKKAVIGLTSIIPGDLLNSLSYTVSLKVIKNNSVPLYEFNSCISFEVEDHREDMYYYGVWPGIVRPQIDSSLFVKELIN